MILIYKKKRHEGRGARLEGGVKAILKGEFGTDKRVTLPGHRASGGKGLFVRIGSFKTARTRRTGTMAG